jgi:hypothetical protein
MLRAKFVEIIETHITCINIFFENCALCVIKWKNMVETDLATDDNIRKAHALFMMEN